MVAHAQDPMEKAEALTVGSRSAYTTQCLRKANTQKLTLKTKKKKNSGTETHLKHKLLLQILYEYCKKIIILKC